MDTRPFNEAAVSRFKPAMYRTTISPGRGIVTTSPQVAERVKRKPVPRSQTLREIHTQLNPLEYGMEVPILGDAEPIAVETPTTLPDISTPTRIYEPYHISSNIPQTIYRDENSNLRNTGGQPGMPSFPQRYDLSGNVGDHSTNLLYPYYSTTPDTAQPKPSNSTSLQSLSLPIQSRIAAMTPLQEVAFVATICLCHFLTQAGLAQSIAPLSIIAKSFTTPTHAPSPSWYSAAYSLTVGTFILPSGRLGDVYGPKMLFVIGWLWFSFSSLAAGFNPRISGGSGGGETFFCFCRAMQGIGPALLMPNGLAILGRTYEDGNRKNLIFALFGASAPVGFVIGAIMSSLLAEKTHWTWAFWSQAIACAVMAAISLFIIPYFPGTAGSPDHLHDSSDKDQVKQAPLWKQLDIPGAFLGVTALVLINIALNQAPLVSWSTPYTYFILIIGLVVLSFFFFIELTPHLTPHPLLPIATLSLDTCFVLACIACGWSTFGIWIFYLWEFLESLRGLGPLLASAQFAPAAISGLLAALTTGFLLSKTTPQVIMVLSMLAFLIGTTIIATTNVDQVYWAQTFFSIVVMPWGMDMSFPSATILLSNKAGQENQGVAMSLVNTVVNYSISVGLGLAGTVQINIDRDGTRILDGFRGAWYFGMGLSGLGLILAIIFLGICTMSTMVKSEENAKIEP